jgi:hypothetical protein
MTAATSRIYQNFKLSFSHSSQAIDNLKKIDTKFSKLLVDLAKNDFYLTQEITEKLLEYNSLKYLDLLVTKYYEFTRVYTGYDDRDGNSTGASSHCSVSLQSSDTDLVEMSETYQHDNEYEKHARSRSVDRALDTLRYIQFYIKKKPAEAIQEICKNSKNKLFYLQSIEDLNLLLSFLNKDHQSRIIACQRLAALNVKEYALRLRSSNLANMSSNGPSSHKPSSREFMPHKPRGREFMPDKPSSREFMPDKPSSREFMPGPFDRLLKYATFDYKTNIPSAILEYESIGIWAFYISIQHISMGEYFNTPIPLQSFSKLAKILLKMVINHHPLKMSFDIDEKLVFFILWGALLGSRGYAYKTKSNDGFTKKNSDYTKQSYSGYTKHSSSDYTNTSSSKYSSISTTYNVNYPCCSPAVLDLFMEILVKLRYSDSVEIRLFTLQLCQVLIGYSASSIY